MGFQEILLEYLQTNELTQAQFAKMVGVKQSQISEWLKGKAKPSYELMKSILQNTDCGADFWFDLN